MALLDHHVAFHKKTVHPQVVDSGGQRSKLSPPNRGPARALGPHGAEEWRRTTQLKSRGFDNVALFFRGDSCRWPQAVGTA
jgi:hypothetical protein